jgi:hypothetical protein
MFKINLFPNFIDFAETFNFKKFITIYRSLGDTCIIRVPLSRERSESLVRDHGPFGPGPFPDSDFRRRPRVIRVNQITC